MPFRSWLCAPALNLKLLTKACEASADIAVLDLEDAVAAENKDAARAALCAHFAAPPQIFTSIRINSPHSLAGLKDLLFLLERGIAPDVLQLPKAALPGDVAMVSALFAECARSVQIFAIIETVESLWALRTLNELPQGLCGLIFGAADFAADLGVAPDATDLRFARQEVVLAARRFGIVAIDSPCFQLRDAARLEMETRDARALGFAGKIAVHPDQVATINRILTPSSQALDAARKLVEASERHPGHSILRVADAMVGPPFLKYARQVLAGSRSFLRR